MPRKPILGFMLVASFGLLRGAQGQTSPSSSPILVRRFAATKLVDKQRQPKEIQAKISLQAQGHAVYSLDLFYRASADVLFRQAHCDLMSNLNYLVRFPYGAEIEYYLVATQLVGGSKKIASGTILGTDLEPSSLGVDPGIGYVSASAAAVMALMTAAITHSDQPATNPRTSSSPVPYVAVGAAIVGTVAVTLIWKNRRKKYKNVEVLPNNH